MLVSIPQTRMGPEYRSAILLRFFGQLILSLPPSPTLYNYFETSSNLLSPVEDSLQDGSQRPLLPSAHTFVSSLLPLYQCPSV